MPTEALLFKDDYVSADQPTTCCGRGHLCEFDYKRAER